MTRATVSVGPPAENDTIMRTGLDGYLSSALAAAAPTSANAMTPAKAAGNRLHQLMTFLPYLNAQYHSAEGHCCRSVNPNARGLDDLAPFRELRPDIRGIFLGRVDDWLEAQRCEALLEVRSRERLGDLAKEEVDDFCWRAGRHDHACERIGLLAQNSGFLRRRHVGNCSRAGLGQHCERAQVAGLDLPGDRRGRGKAHRRVGGGDKTHPPPPARERAPHAIVPQWGPEKVTPGKGGGAG